MRLLPADAPCYESIRVRTGLDLDPVIARPIDDGLEILTPAKLNLFLEVLGKRPDGYHEIESLMVTVDLFDSLTFHATDSGRIELVCDDPTLTTGPDNLVVKAAEQIRVESGCDRGVRIELRKAIPTQAGLAGGSSDAAATLMGIDRLWNLQTAPDRMDALAASIGSDVAFFRQGPAAICRGRGEVVTPCSLFRAIHFVLICPPVGVATAAVYRHLIPPESTRSIAEIREALEAGDVPALGHGLFNRLQPVAESLEPSLGAVRDALVSLGPSLIVGQLMSGSGSAYFGLARDRDAAEEAADRLAKLGLGRVRVVTSGL